jgi:hypothetical protein
MARAILRIFPGARLAFGPTTHNGFYYDIDLPARPLSEADFPAIEDRMRAHIVAVLLHAADLIGCRDDRIGVLGGKGAAARRAAGLHKSRPPLRRWHGIEGAAALEELALEMDRVNLAPITIDAAFAVHHHRTGLPRIEELVH